MRKVIEWGFANVEQGGGPFSAGVFDLASGQCLSVGLNRVVDTHCSVAHAEMMALMLAQQAVGSHDLSTYGPVVLTTSAQPCSQCFGALPWAGIQAMEFGAGREEVEAIGFDEGPCPDNWRKALESRGIAVQGPLLASEALRLLQTYQQRGGQLY
jgi:tRNA(Arg) A34 adenosine deaminase TadA